MADIDEEAAFFQGTDNPASHTESWQLTPCERALLDIKLAVMGVGLLFMFMVLTASNFTFDSRDATDFSMELAGFQGLNATTLGGHTVSPWFSLKVHVENNYIVVQPWCYSGGDAVVSYSDMALAWGHVPRFCIKGKKMPVELTVVPWGRRIGLSEDLHRRLASDLQMGTAKVKVEMKVFYDDKGVSSAERKDGPVFKSFELMLNRHEEDPK